MVCLRDISVDTLHKGDTDDDDDNNNLVCVIITNTRLIKILQTPN
jgi:hypothetical protein